jgi:hypothetical protein
MKRKSPSQKKSKSNNDQAFTDGSCSGPISTEQSAQPPEEESDPDHPDPTALGPPIPVDGTPAMASLSNPLNELSLNECLEFLNIFRCLKSSHEAEKAENRPKRSKKKKKKKKSALPPETGGSIPETFPLPHWPDSGGFKGTERLHLIGNLHPGGLRKLTINGSTVLKLDRRQFLALLVLFCQSLSSVGREVPLQVPDVPFLAASDFIDPVADYLNNQRPRPDVFLSPNDGQFTRVICQIRKMFKEERLNWFIIEPGYNGKSYRLGVPPRNLRLTFYDITTARRWNISGI